MNREVMLRRLDEADGWDIIVVGGGATGLGCAIDAAARGYRTLLLERGDFAQGTSSRSTKLAHGGVRYLQQGDVALVTEALHERGLMRRNAGHLVHDRQFVVPNYDWWEAPFYGIGLKVYDLLAGKLGFGKSRLLFRRGNCRAEVCRVSVAGWRGVTIALEAADLPSIAEALDDLHLGALPNRSYGEALLRHAPAGTRRRRLPGTPAPTERKPA